MTRVAVGNSSRISLRISAEEKTMLLRAVALQHTNLTDFVLRHAVYAAKEIVENAEHLRLSERDTLRVLDLLENPPPPNERLLAAAQALPQRT